MLHLDWRFLPVFDRVDPNSAYAGVYQAGLVALSVLVAAIAAFVALSISGRIAAAGSRRERWAWASAGAAAMGGGIWGMHFIGMLAFSLPCGVSYNPPETILSMIPGILASGVALHIISDRREPTFGRLLIGAVLMGGGIGAMHYTGMAAMEPQALLRYDPVLVVVSIVVAVALSFVALGIRFRLRAGHGTGVVATAIAAPVMGCAVAGMHYTAMQASVFYPLADAQLSLMSMSPGLLAGLITVFTVLIMGTVLVAAFAGRQVELARELAAEVARREVLETDAENGRARLQAIFDAAVDAIVTVDEGGRILQWSKGAERILGYSADEAVGEDFSMLMPPRRRRRRQRYLQFALASQHRGMTGSGRETVAQRKDGSEFPVELSISRVRAGSEFLLTGILRDITERKRVEQDLIQARVQAEAANRAKSQFLATMSHEMRTPLNGVLGTTNLLAATRLTARQTRLVQNLERSGQALLGVISDILDLSKIEAGRFELAANDFEPRELVAEVTDLFAERCAAKGLEFVYFVAETVPGRLRGDAARLRQILINLVGNAMKFTEQGEIYLELEASEIGPDEATLTCSVRDTGIGIPRDQQERIFSSFHQVDASTTRSRGGSGLGLAIVKELVSLMGGQVGVESEPGIGSRFWFTVRLGRAEEAGAAERNGRRMERRLRVLIVDGNPVSARITATYCMGWDIDTAVRATVAEGRAAWREAIACAQPFDVAIIDVKGLGAEAVELAQAMRADRHHRRTETVLMIGLDSPIDESTLAGIGAYAVLTKPARPSLLFDCLASIASGAKGEGVASFYLRRNGAEPSVRFAARILVAEDNPVNQDVATGILEAMGCGVVTAPNGRAAVERCAAERFDLILMDCEMPIMDGFDAARAIRAAETAADAPRTPIVALTAHALAEIRDRCLAAGMDDFLVKPFDRTQMADMLGRWLIPRQAGPAPAAAPEPAAAAAAEAPEAALDMAAIGRIRSIAGADGASLLSRVVGQFEATAPPLLATMRAKSRDGDAEAVWRAAHSLKSSAGAIGAREVSRQCAQIEALARNDGTLPSDLQLATLADALATATQALHGLVAADGATPAAAPA